MAKTKFTKRELFLMEIYQKEIDSREEKIRSLELQLSLNKLLNKKTFKISIVKNKHLKK